MWLRNDEMVSVSGFTLWVMACLLSEGNYPVPFSAHVFSFHPLFFPFLPCLASPLLEYAVD
jgi:hypothetical protein